MKPIIILSEPPPPHMRIDLSGRYAGMPWHDLNRSQIRVMDCRRCSILRLAMWQKESLNLKVGDWIIWRDEAIESEDGPAFVSPGF